MKLNKTCETCEFCGICDESDKLQRELQITEKECTCENWDFSFPYFSEVIKNMPWYIQEPYKYGRISFLEAIKKLEEDETDNGTSINIYDAITHVYNLSVDELGKVLNVKPTVILYAITHGTIHKRKQAFATILQIPEEYFDIISSSQLSQLEHCKDEFYNLTNPH